jgi:alkanesulfonate monooxygenase SsuD/methylene tetrahydromethanopterin reductase-like flavin-dependent oxidoreductase (luciferase family)
VPALRRVARHGDGWYPVGTNPAVPLRPPELRAALEQFFRMTEAEGRDPSALTFSFKAPVDDTTATTLDGADRRPFSGTPQQVADHIVTYEKLGVSELIFDFRSEHLTETLERIERFVETVQ